jgi:sensor histidine kinase YesM
MIPNYFNRYLFIIIPLVGILIVGLYIISNGINDYENSVQYLIHGLVITSGLWLGCMSIVMLLWKRFPWEHAPFTHLILEIVLITVYTLAFSSVLYFLERRFWKIHMVENLGMEILTTILITYFITSIHESVFFYQQWKYNFSKSVRLERDNIEAKFEALRAQINPHFLFNSLNSLTTMVEDNKPVVDYIQSLSDLLRYMLKSGEKELVQLREEVTVMNSYIRLQKMRFPETLNINVDVPENCYQYTVPPLVLQMLIENAIKHNIISKDKPLKISITASKESVTVTNNLQKKSVGDSTGQGLKNITGRYRFFTTRKVEINETGNSFSVTIPLLKVEL